ncbi:magnesium/cobalt transporter CorA [Candidatus Gracilibacteria bacterium]|nr:magnesium/cobalt transporter CorA [Candidatus Gracilibacteria bacterium]
MKKLISHSSNKVGLAPGSPVYTGEKNSELSIVLFNYTEKKAEKKEFQKLADLKAAFDKRTKTWIKIQGISDVQSLSETGEFFGLHALALEDIANTNQRAKIERIEDRVFITLKGLEYNERKKEFVSQQISFLLGDNFVLSFHEQEDDTFGPLEARLQNPKSRIRQRSMEYFSYAIVDMLVDQYFVALEKFGEQVEILDRKILKNRSSDLLSSLHVLKKEILFFRKVTLPVLELVKKFKEELLEGRDKTLDMYFQDLYDHVLQVNELSKTYTEILAGMFDLYFSLLSLRTNRVMQALTVITMVFMPLTLIAGIYGMNFEKMPELSWEYGYPFVLILMAVIVGIVLAFMKKKQWL